MRKILYLDMDGVLVNFESAIPRVPDEVAADFKGRLDDIPGVFALMDPFPGALEAFEELSVLFDTYLLSTAPWENPSAWTDKVEWVQRHLSDQAKKRLILSHNKHLNRGDYLVDDRTQNGAGKFRGEHILFGYKKFPDWATVTRYLREHAY